MKKTLLAAFVLLLSFHLFSQTFRERIDLSGEWQFDMDRQDVGVKQSWFARPLHDKINLPGSMPENLKGDLPGLKTQWTGSLYDSSFFYNPLFEKYRQEGRVKFPFFLTPDRHYVGVAWYRKEIVIPAGWSGKPYALFLERPHTLTRVWMDEKEIGHDSSYCVPHVFSPGNGLKPGKHHLTIRIDNRIGAVDVGQDSHSVTDQTQGNWNGVVGKIVLESLPVQRLSDVQIYPDLAAHRIKLVVTIHNSLRKTVGAVLRYQAKSFNTHREQHTTDWQELQVQLLPGIHTYTTELFMGNDPLTWSEFDPALYSLDLRLNAGASDVDMLCKTFGMREITIQGKWFYVNGRKTQLRGTVENCDFPLTGYAPMDVKSWERIFRICRSYGLNHMRFHSYCPPDAAFEAADLVGFYLQAEGPSWPNHGSSLGDGRPVDQFLMDETKRMTHEYGNHPSFCMMAVGNEPRGRWVPWVTRFVNYWKQTDARRVYTGASVGGGWAWQPGNQYHVKAGARGLDWDRGIPESVSDFSAKIDTVSVPFVSHETGQWCAFPDFDEIKCYTGVKKARNFELFKEDLQDHNMAGLGHDFLMASGKLQVLAYKHDIEKNLRTRDYAGFELLGLNDYSGQGTALVGVLNVFWKEKGYCTASDFRQFCGPVVPLIRTGKFVWQSNEHLTATVELSYFGALEKIQIQPRWTLKNAIGAIVAEGSLPEKSVETGLCNPLGKLDLDLSFVQAAGKYTLEVRTGCDGFNSWDFYLYPAAPAGTTSVSVMNAIRPAGKDEILVATNWNPQVEEALNQGRDVLLLAAGRVTYGKEVVQTLAPVFWNTSWFKMRPPHTTGLLIHSQHPIFSDFPTEDYADLHWWELMNKAQVMQFTDFPADFQPLIQSIDTWFVNRKIGMLFEARVGKGRLVMTTCDLESRLHERPVARQLLQSIARYMYSMYFRPQYTMDAERISDLFTKVAGKVNMFTTDSPDELKPKQNLVKP